MVEGEAKELVGVLLPASAQKIEEASTRVKGAWCDWQSCGREELIQPDWLRGRRA
jgi:hypothetical protein